jgi:hypothetical protein
LYRVYANYVAMRGGMTRLVWNGGLELKREWCYNSVAVGGIALATMDVSQLCKGYNKPSDKKKIFKVGNDQ